MKRLLIGLLSILLITSCAASNGEKAAKNVIRLARKGNPEQVKTAIQYYGERLEGEDMIDFYEALERAGIY